MNLIFLSLLFCTFSVVAQTNPKLVRLEHYVMDSFAHGKVKLKSGKVTNQLLNYNLITKEMIFVQGEQYLALAHPEEVDTVFIGQRKFVPVNNSFYEWLEGTTYPLFAEFTCTVKEPGVQTGFGTSNTTASASLQLLVSSGGVYGLKLPDEFKIIAGQSFYIRKNDQYNKFKNEQQLIKLFPDKKQVIKDSVKNNHTNFSKPGDIVLVIQQIQ